MIEVDPNALLAISFTMWAGVVAWIGRGVFKRLDAITKEMRAETEKLNAYMILTEQRIAVLEHEVFKRKKDAI